MLRIFKNVVIFVLLMDKTDKCRKLAGEITSYFEDGITLDSHTKRYIDTCIPDISFQGLANRICIKADFDDAPLMELIFFPDEALQLRLEPLLEKDIFNVADENEITKRLLEADIQTTLRETGSNATLPIQVPAFIFAPFVRRLKISRQIPQQLRDTIHKIIPTEEITRLKVELRNTRFPFSPQVTSFLDCILKRINPAAEYFRDCLDLVLGLLDEQKHESDPYLLPKAKRDVFIRAKHTAAEFMHQLQYSNMETLMLRGIRAPEISIEDADRKIDLLERVIEATKPGGLLI